MAIYHFNGSVISRNKGRSSVAASAYRSASELYDERQDKTHDYTRKQDVAFTEILLPENAPAWMADRQKLWNTVEAVEKRKDAQLAREFNFALPKELTLEQNIELAREFVKNEFVARGMVADLAVHNDRTPEGEPQPHAHVMLTFREVTPDGFGQKVRAWNAKENLLLWREAWAETANRHLFLNGHDITIDHRTLEAQGIALEPQYKIGAAIAKNRMARLEDHQRIAKENGEKIFNEPKIALDALTRQQSTFTHHDIARFLNRHTDGAEQFQRVYDKVKSSEQLVQLGVDEKFRERFTTQDMLAVETSMSKKACALAETQGHTVSDISKAQAMNARSLTDEQQAAFHHLVADGDLKNVVGFAGSGKSYLLGAAKDAWEKEGYRVHGVALSGIAAENLEAGSGIVSRTIASRCYYWNKGEQQLTAKDILVVDEAGMIGSRQLNRLLEEAANARAKIVLVGDPYQLQAIEAGAAFRAVTEQTPTVFLTDIRRQQEAWQRNATVELATGNTEAAISRYAEQGRVHAFETQVAAKKALIETWNEERLNAPEKTQLILAYTRDDVKEFNALARETRQSQGELGKDHGFLTARGERQFAEADRLYFLANDRNLGVKNGTLGTIEKIDGSVLTVRLDKQQLDPHKQTVSVDLKTYNQLDHGYAATVHKSQGATVDRAYLLASKYLDAHATYVGLSRHRENADIFYGRDEFANDKALSTTLGRERQKDVTLDYRAATQFAVQRGFEQIPPVLQQEKIQETTRTKEPQTQQQYYEKLLQQAAQKTYNLEHKMPVLPQRDFSQFKAEFEREHPRETAAIRESVRPRHERLALEAKERIAVLEKACVQSKTPRTFKEELGRYAANVAKQKDVMEYLKQKEPELSVKIQSLSKSYEKERGFDRGLSR